MSFDVVTAALTEHAHGLTGLADETTQAGTTAGGVNVTGDTFGRTAQGFATFLDTVARAGNETLTAAVRALEAAASDLRDTATDYDRVDTAEATRLTGVGTDLA